MLPDLTESLVFGPTLRPVQRMMGWASLDAREWPAGAQARCKTTLATDGQITTQPPISRHTWIYNNTAIVKGLGGIYCLRWSECGPSKTATMDSVFHLGLQTLPNNSNRYITDGWILTLNCSLALASERFCGFPTGLIKVSFCLETGL